jgi:hypothetical protein
MANARIAQIPSYQVLTILAGAAGVKSHAPAAVMKVRSKA